MHSNWEIIGREGFNFFGKMSVSISHEIKNVLAIINENAGLLSDLTMMAERGTPIEPERLKKISLNIGDQVKRADLIAKNMNQFAHSADEPIKAVSIDELIMVVLKLSLRFAASRGVNLEHQPLASPLSVTTSPFLLENLLWRCLDRAMGNDGEKKTVTLAVKKVDDGIALQFMQLENIRQNFIASFPGEQERELLSLLKARLEIHEKSGDITLYLPNSIIN